GETERALGNYDASFEVFQAGRRICAEIGQRLADAYMLCNIAHVTLQRGDAAESLAWAGQSSELADRLGDRDLQAALANVGGHALAALGRLDEAEERYRASAALFREIGRTTMPYEPLAGRGDRRPLRRRRLGRRHRGPALDPSHLPRRARRRRRAARARIPRARPRAF